MGEEEGGGRTRRRKDSEEEGWYWVRKAKANVLTIVAAAVVALCLRFLITCDAVEQTKNAPPPSSLSSPSLILSIFSLKSVLWKPRTRITWDSHISVGIVQGRPIHGNRCDCLAENLWMTTQQSVHIVNTSCGCCCIGVLLFHIVAILYCGCSKHEREQPTIDVLFANLIRSTTPDGPQRPVHCAAFRAGAISFIAPR